MLQLAHLDHPIVPVFVCRKAHKTTFWMAQQLGFVVIDMGIQFAGDVDEEEIFEVRHELHFQDLARGRGPSLRVRDRLTSTLPRICQDTAVQWKETCLDLEMAVIITRLRRAEARQHEALITDLRDMNTSMGRRGGW
jgi:hypothetical protein